MTATCRPTLTIIVPTFNSIEQLPGCLDSIQGVLGKLLGKTVFILIQDGRSTDGTIEYAQSTKTEGVTIVSEQDKGVYDAMNKAVARTDTDWVYFLGSDDRLLSDFTAMLDQLTNTGCIHYANVKFLSTGKRYDGPFSPTKLVFRNICHQCLFFPRQVLQDGPYSLNYPIKSDWATNIRLLACTPFQYVNLEVALYNDQGGLSSTYEDTQFEKDKATLFYESHGYPLGILCSVAPVVTRFFHFLTRRKTKEIKEFRSI